ncbi:MAG: hypothetical protein ABIG67_04730, partial [Pseudomonadota bacterium]
KAVTPLPVLRSSRATEGGKNGVQRFCNCSKILDSRLRGNDRTGRFRTFYERINFRDVYLASYE